MSSIAIVLAGGASRRMGVDKLMLPRFESSMNAQDVKEDAPVTAANAQSILQHVVAVASEVAEHVVICTRPENVCSVYETAKVDIMVDESPYQGPLVALNDAWHHVAMTDEDEIFIIAGDLPGLSSEVLVTCRDRLQKELASNGVVNSSGVVGSLGAKRAGPDAVVVMRESMAQPLLGCYHARAGRAWADSVEQGEQRLMVAIARLQLLMVDAGSEGWPQWWTRPVHTPTDYDAWLRAGRWLNA